MTAAESLLFLPSAICITWMIYNNIAVYQHRESEFIQKRGISLVLGFNFAIGMELIVSTLTMIGSLYLFQTLPILEMIITLCRAIVVYFCIFFLNVKAWMIYYQYYWTYYTLQLKWQQLINPNFVDEENKHNWYIKNKSKYGQLSYIYKLFAIPHCLITIINASIICYYELVHVDTLPFLMLVGFMIILTLFLVVFYGVIVKKTPSFDDIYYIHRENILLSRILILGFILIFIVSGVSSYIVEVVYNWDPKLMRLSGALNNYPSMFMWFGISYLSTSVIIHKNKTQKLPRMESNSNNLREELNAILRDELQINKFIEYLSREYVPLHLKLSI